MFIEQPAIYLRWLYPKAYWRMDRHEKAVYLTFDDGPIPEATPFILDTLKAFDAKRCQSHFLHGGRQCEEAP